QDGWIIAEGAIAVNFTPVGEDALHVIQHERSLRMPSQLRLLPGVDVLADLLAQKTDLVLKVLELQASVFVLPCLGFEVGDLLFDVLELTLRLKRWFQKIAPSD